MKFFATLKHKIADVLLLKRWHDKVAFKRTKIKQQKKITSYFVNPNVL